MDDIRISPTTGGRSSIVRCNSVALLGLMTATLLSQWGCISQPGGAPDAQVSGISQMKVAQPFDRAGDNYEWIKRLRISEPADHVQQVAAPGSQIAFPVPVPYSAPGPYSLIVNKVSRMAWLRSREGTLGPWSLDHPDVRHLVESVAIPPTNSAAEQ